MECPSEVKLQIIDYIREQAYHAAKTELLKTNLASSEITAISLFNSAQMFIPKLFNRAKDAWDLEDGNEMFSFPLILDDVLLDDNY